MYADVYPHKTIEIYIIGLNEAIQSQYIISINNYFNILPLVY